MIELGLPVMATTFLPFSFFDVAEPLIVAGGTSSSVEPSNTPLAKAENLVSLGVWPSYTHYCVSKAGCIMLTQCLARALGPEILVNSVAPGTIQFPGEPPDEEYIRRVPLHRTGIGHDIAQAVAYLATADFVTGQVLIVDGGRALV